ncbi:hypothetical protein CVT25_008020 [Psilocybe cyanescens]|uniref:Kinesin motor domain-containing protein n=1 Tax=Psilocybe cyanescens TaxID=93625 RepID=A0A409XTJ1_PSICY|nr:hypothetical protein CVT25_008020 [Psilocybe cyanescens]
MLPPQQLQQSRSVLAAIFFFTGSRFGHTGLCWNIWETTRKSRHGDTHSNINGPKEGKELTIQILKLNSSPGMHTRAPTQTFPYDIDFGPEANQSMIFHNVIAPLVKEIIEGYNSTVFAYGFIMQGDLAPSPVDGPALTAGIIPRVIIFIYGLYSNNILYGTLQRGASGPDFDIAAHRPVSTCTRINNNLNPMPPPQQLQRPQSIMSQPPSSSLQRIASDT